MVNDSVSLVSRRFGRARTPSAADGGLPPGARFVADDPSCAAPQCFEVDIPLPADMAVTNNTVRVLLPAGHADSAHRYPLLYLCDRAAAAGDEHNLCANASRGGR